MAVFGGGSVAPLDNSSGLWVDAELYKSMTNNKAEYGGKLGFLHLIGADTLLCDWASGRDWLSHVTSNSGSRLWDF
jgi:hypothetical protein